MPDFFNQFSLRTKLVSLYAALLILSIALVSYYSYWNIWQLLIIDKSSHLRARAKPTIEHWLIVQGLTKPDAIKRNFTSHSTLILARTLTSRDTIAVVFNRKGKIIANGKCLPEELVAPIIKNQYFKQAISGKNEITYFDEINEQRVLVFLIPIRIQPGNGYIFGVIQISTSLSDINKILFHHVSKQVIAIAIILGSGILFGYWLIGMSLKELHILSTSCQEIAKGNFSQRPQTKNRQDEIGKLAASFNLMSDKLEKLFASQKRFVANAAHELLTPLTGLRGSLEVLLRGAQDDPEAVNRLCKGMYKEVNHLIRLCDQLLGLSCLENTANISKKQLVLSNFMKEFEQKIRQLTQTHSIIIQQGPFLTLLADPDLLEQILLNLFSNAIRYSLPEAPIVLGWKLLPEHVEISVTDQGKGIDKETLSHVFEPFYRGKNQKLLEEKGSGLGLSLVKSMVQAHEGSIRIESTLCKGTTVFFILPLQ